MDKTSFFFTANCGVCHPGGAAMQYDREGRLYYDRSTSLYGYAGGTAAPLPAAAQLDGDYGFITPSSGVPATGNWAKTGVSEADCLMCHMTQSATAPGSPTHDNGLSWHKRAATLRGTGVAGVANFEWAPTAGAGWASVSYVSGQSPPMASAVTLNYGLGIAAGTLVDQGGNLAIAEGKIGPARDANCRGCHSIPDGKKSGRTLLPTTDAHMANGVACTRCHTSSLDGSHQIGKGDITIGSVRNDLDNTVKSCSDCHLGGADFAAPNPTPKHAAIPSFHFTLMKCQVCHIRHLDDDPVSPTQDIPELVIEMTSNGTQNVSIWSAYLGTNPLDPSLNLPELAGRPFRWYPVVRPYKGKLQTVKPLYTAWFGEWISGTGLDAQIRPIPLRLVRRALTGLYPAGSPRLASLTLTPGSKVASGATVLHRKAEIRAFLIAMRDATDTANTTTPNDIVTRPVLVRAEKVYFLNAVDEVEWFHSPVGESHDFAVNHNVAIPRDPANPVVNPGPYGAGGCNDCHGPSSTFFYTKSLVEPAQYDYLDELGTVPNPASGQPLYSSRYEHMGYTEMQAGELTGTLVPVIVNVQGAYGTVAISGQRTGSTTCSASSGGCKVGVAPGGTLSLTATPSGGGTFQGWSGCTPSGGACTLTVGVPTSGLGNSGGAVSATFLAPPPPPPPTTYVLQTSMSGGQGRVTGGGLDCLNNGGTCKVTVASGTAATLTAAPSTGYAFTGWLYCPTPSGATCNVSVTKNTLVSATFEPTTFAVAVRIATGKGTVAGSGFDCRNNTFRCLVSAPRSTVLSMTATPDAGYQFTSWTGCQSPSGNTCTMTVSGGATVKANFAAVP